MAVFSKFFRPLHLAAKAFFRHDIALKRGDTGAVEIVLEARPPGGRRLSAQEQRELAAKRKQKEEFDQLLSELAGLLDELPETRSAMKQLVFIEHALQKKGVKALHKLPLPVLQKGLEQLEGLVTNWSPVGLANLRSKMAVAIIDREHHDPEKEADAYRTAAVMEHDDQLPPVPNSQQPEVVEHLSDEDALAAAYAALGAVTGHGEIELQGELGTRSTKAMAPPPPRPTENAGPIEIRRLETS